METIYFVGGIAGIGKTSHFVNKLSQRGKLCIETDYLRPNFDVGIPNLTVDEFAWVCVRHIIKHRTSLPSNEGLVFLGVACEPKLIKQLEIDEPTITLKTALIGASKQFHRFERYLKPEPDEIAKCERLKREMVGLADCKYFDLIECASPEEQANNLVRITEEEVGAYADKIIKEYLS